jgi:hypothetical protein
LGNIQKWGPHQLLVKPKRSDQGTRLKQQERTHKRAELMSLNEYISLLGAFMILQTFAKITTFPFISLFIIVTAHLSREYLFLFVYASCQHSSQLRWHQPNCGRTGVYGGIGHRKNRRRHLCSKVGYCIFNQRTSDTLSFETATLMRVLQLPRIIELTLTNTCHANRNYGVFHMPCPNCSIPFF